MFLYLLSVLLFLPCLLTSCPPACHCSNPAGGQYSLLCNAANLTRIPFIAQSKKPVQILILDNNNLTRLPSFAFFDASWQDLQKLSLRNCNINPLPENLFYRLKSLKVLNLSGNLLTGFLPRQFSHLLSLTSLDLSHNALSSITGSVLASLNLSHLSLAGNALTTLPLSTFPLLTSLKHLDLSDNPWQCDNRLAGLHAQLVKINAVPGQTTCRTPLVLLDSLWTDLLSSDFVSKPAVTAHHLVTTWPGQTASLICNVTGSHATEVLWLAGERVVVNNTYPSQDKDPHLYQKYGIRLTEHRLSEYTSIFRSVLSIRNMSKVSDATQYSCLAINNAGMEQKLVTLRLRDNSQQTIIGAAVSASIIALLILLLFVIIISIGVRRRFNFHGSLSSKSSSISIFQTSRLEKGLKNFKSSIPNPNLNRATAIIMQDEQPVVLSRNNSDQTVILADDQTAVISDNDQGWMSGGGKTDSISTGYVSLSRAGSDQTEYYTLPRCGDYQTGHSTLPRCGDYQTGKQELSADGLHFYPLVSSQPRSRASIGRISVSTTDQFYSIPHHHHSHPPYLQNHPFYHNLNTKGHVTLPRRHQPSYDLPPYPVISSTLQPYDIPMPRPFRYDKAHHPGLLIHPRSSQCQLGTISEVV